MIKIKVIDPKKPEQLQEVDLDLETKLNQECYIGRLLNCDLVLDGTEVSRMHGKISQKNENYYYADLASSYGSRLNGENAQVNQDYLLKANDLIQVGRYFLMIVQISSLLTSSNVDTIIDLPQVEKTSTTTDNQEISNGLAPEPKVETKPVEAPFVAPVIPPQEYMPLAMVEPADLQRWTKGDLTVRCIGVIDETHDVRTFRFVADPPVLFSYKPGQFVTLDLEINKEEISRSYSISSTPSRPHTLEITVKRVPAPVGCQPETPKGLVSNWLHDNVKPGSIIKLNGPLGKFTCFANPSQKLLLISAGSGITPMMSMSRWLCDTGANCDIIFFHCARSPRDIIYRHELEMMSARYANFHLAVSTTRTEPGHSWLSLTGRLDPAMLQVVAPDYRIRTVYVCGPDTFMESTKQMLESISFPMQNYYEESFGPPKKKPKSVEPKQETVASSTPQNVKSAVGFMDMMRNWSTQSVGESNSSSDRAAATASVATPTPTLPKSTSSGKTAVVFSKSGKEVDCDGEEPILDLADQEKVKIRSSCRAGVCGSCKKRKLEGEVRLEGEPEGLEESEVQEGYILTCISYPVGKVVIDA
ncbi:FHA domain-containing protein [Hassallia byssoidea VB512170]|uniref:Ferredoxin--NADP reductase n=1 Tax=Hassallia byssoidea VB512170 TaxID=1304833 RepID=A0A846HDI7_9CYAN|nr:FAD-binding oxidoreductase [Hassalia byssoidea]NEU75627.1 FHA domain-containing protein [Hassalia byssoidea VB512170]